MPDPRTSNLPSPHRQPLAARTSKHVVVPLSGERQHSGDRGRLPGRVSPAPAGVADPVLIPTAAVRLVPGAFAAAAIRRDGSTEILPGYEGDPLLVSTSPAVAVARGRIGPHQPYSSFLWPRNDRHRSSGTRRNWSRNDTPPGNGSRSDGQPAGYLRITVLALAGDESVLGAVVLSPAGQLHQLTARELEILGLMIEGYSNPAIAAELVLAQRTVATHVEHVLAKLSAGSRTMAAVRAERAGLYLPSAHQGAPR